MEKRRFSFSDGNRRFDVFTVDGAGAWKQLAAILRVDRRLDIRKFSIACVCPCGARQQTTYCSPFCFELDQMNRKAERKVAV